MFKSVDAADTDVHLVRVETFKGFCEPLGDLAGVSELVTAGGIKQSDTHNEASSYRGDEQTGVVAIPSVNVPLE